MNEFDDLYSTEGIRRTPKEPAPLPWERVDVQGLAAWLRPAVDTCEKVQEAALVNELVGDTPETVLADSPALEQVRKVLSLPRVAPTFSTPLAIANFLKLATRLQEVQKRAPERQRTIAGILSDIRKKLGGPTNQEAWNRLQQSCENFVASALIA
jgi:hypothetical protein